MLMVSCPGPNLPWPQLNCVPGLLAPPAERSRCVEAASCRQGSHPQHSALLRVLCWRLRQPAQSRQPHRAACHSAPSSSSGTSSRQQARPCAQCCRGRRSSASLSASPPPVPAPQHLPGECAAHMSCLSVATLPVPRAPRYIYSDTVTKPRWQLIMHQLSQATRLPPSPTRTHTCTAAAAPHRLAPRTCMRHGPPASGPARRGERRRARSMSRRGGSSSSSTQSGGYPPPSSRTSPSCARCTNRSAAASPWAPCCATLSRGTYRSSTGEPPTPSRSASGSRQLTASRGRSAPTRGLQPMRVTGCNHVHHRGCHPMSPGCNPMSTRSAATRCPSRSPERRTETGGSHPVELAQRLQPHGTRAATSCHPGCNPTRSRLQPRVT